MTTLGQRLREVRGNLTQTQFGKTLGITQAVVSSMETDRTCPTLHHLILLRKVYKTDINWLITGSGDGPAAADLASMFIHDLVNKTTDFQRYLQNVQTKLQETTP